MSRWYTDQMKIRRLLLIPMFGFLLLCTSACSTVGYYSQAVSGHVKLMLAREPIEDLLNDENTDPELRTKLQTLLDAREFAYNKLNLPKNDSYSTYVETGRDYITWNVIAADEFSVQARTWCFPIAGCVSYRGYFDKADAEAYASSLEEDEQLDITLTGASAYSTLGWFDDPVFDTMLRGGDIRYVSTLFHELSHQLLYVKDDSNFNEAFASFVEQEGARIWLRERGESARVKNYNAYLKRGTEFADLLRLTRDELQEVYSSEESDATKRTLKQQTFDNMLKQYEQLKLSWNGYGGYDRWFSRKLNNARLVSVSTYRRYVPAFEAMYLETGSDLTAFYKLAKDVSELPAKERQAKLEAYLHSTDS